MDLARPGDPYMTARGEMVVKNEEEVDTLTREDSFVPIIRKMNIRNKRSVGDLPASDRSQQTAINAILGYQLLGLTYIEIAEVLKLDPNTVQNLQHSAEYQTTFEEIFNELLSTHSNSLRARIAAFATEGVDNMVELARTAKKEVVKFKANEDLLNRAGLNAEQLYGSTNGDDGDALKIVIEDGGSGNTTKVEVDLSKVRRR